MGHHSTHRKARPPLTEEGLADLALSYVGRFATTRAKLRSYLDRKVRERGWAGEREPDLEALADRYAQAGYIDDAGFALMKSRALSSRGYGPGRVRQALRMAGVVDQDADAAQSLADSEAVRAALRFAERRRLGPFAEQVPDPKGRKRAIAAMIRAGHTFALARAVIGMRPGAAPDELDQAAST